MKQFLLLFFLIIFNVNHAQSQRQNFANNNGQHIHYKVAGKGTPVVLLFGFGMSLEEWFEFGYADELIANSFQVVAIETRGHGKSDAPKSSDEYSLKKLATDVISVLDNAEIEQAHILAYSLGAKIALGVAKYYPERMNHLILGGFEIASEVDFSNDIVSSTLQSGANQWAKLWETLLDMPSPMKQRLGKADTQALLALRQKEAEWHSFEPYLNNLQAPVLLFVGENCFTREDMRRADNLIESSELFVVSEKDHFTLIGSMNPVIEKTILFLK